ncbi:Ig-like domain-containing protein [Aquimonas voraii]|nr:Ig-like domain-containing protein [Aquimonas voraii]
MSMAEVADKASAESKAQQVIEHLPDGRVRMTAPMQDLEALIGLDGVAVRSTDEAGDAGFHWKVTGVGRGASLKAVPVIWPEALAVHGEIVQVRRPGVIEEFRADADGIRQDFVVPERPSGDGELVVEVAAEGAQISAVAQADGQAVKVQMADGRRLHYHQLHVTDARGEELAARMEMTAAGGLRIAVNDATAAYPVRIDPTFSDADWTALDVPGFNGVIYSITLAGNQVVVGGDFTAANGGVLANRLAVWNGSSWSGLGSGVDSAVFALAWDAANSRLYAGGSFTIAGGAAASRIAVWNGSSWSALGIGMNDAVWSLALDAAGGRLFAGGDFTTAGGAAANRIAFWNGSAWAGLTSGLNSGVRALAWNATTGRLAVGGGFTTAGGISANRIALWNGAAWAPLGGGVTGGAVQALAWDVGGGRLFAGGNFTSAGGSAASSVAVWNGSNWAALGSGVFGPISAMAWDAAGARLFVGGGLLSAGGSSVRSIAVWNGTAWASLGTGVNNVIWALAWDASTARLIVAGQFTEAGGLVANRIAVWDNGSWSAIGLSGISSSVSALAWDPDSARLFVGGAFAAAGGVGANGVAVWNGNGWSGLANGVAGSVSDLAWDAAGGRLFVGGNFGVSGVVGSSNIALWDGNSWAALGGGVSGGTVSALAWDSVNGQLFAGGDFTNAGGASVNRIAVWNGNGWAALGSGVNSLVSDLAWDAAGARLFAGGLFTNAGGTTVNRIAAWNGNSWSALGSGLDGSVFALAWNPSSGVLAVGGAFSAAGGVAASRIAVWTGSAWDALAGGVDGAVRAVVWDEPGRRLFVGGEFTIAGGLGANRIAMWDGSGWSSLGSGMDNRVFTLAWDSSNGRLFAGGNFVSAGGRPSAVAQAQVGLKQTVDFPNPGPQSFGTTPTLSATASSGLTVTFTSSTTGVCTITAGGTLSFLTTGTCTINADQAGDATFDAAPRVSQSFAVINAPIDAVNDSGTVANGASGGIAVADVLLNDTLNDAPATLASVTLTQLSTSNPNITLNPATGAVAVAAATPAGTYTLTYQICEQLNPTNCDNATATVTVGAAIIDAVNDSGTVANGASGGTAVANVLVNDTLNDAPATLASVTLTQLSTSNPNITLNPATGAVAVAAATPAGTYTLTYRICEQLNPTNCDDATATVTVGAAIIDAVSDSGTVANGASGGVAVADVLLNDALNAAPATLTSVTLTQLSTSNPNITLNPATGAVAVAAATPAGTYTLTYRICEQLNPTNCDNAIATVTVGAALIDAVDEDYTGTQVNGASGGTLPTVLVNDTLNGGAATVGDGGNVTLTPGAAPTPAAGSIAMNADGTITIAAGTTAGVYTYAYTICELLNPTNCDTATVTVNVGAALIDAVDDSGTVPNGAAGGTAVANVLVNDTLNDAAATLASVTLTQLSTSHPNLTLNPATGAVSVAAATPAGTYTLTYQACEQLNPTNCDAATATVTVGAAIIDAVNDSGTVANGAAGGTAVANVLVNDTLNDAAATLASVTLTQLSTSNPNVTLNPATGAVAVAAATPAGTYTLTYHTCEQLNPTNCDDATATVTVGAAIIDAVNDSGTVANGAAGGTAVANVLVNDTLNDAAATLASVTLTQISTSHPNITLNPATGAVSAAAATPVGSYTLTYRICEQLNPTNCDSATVSVTVNALAPTTADSSVTVGYNASATSVPLTLGGGAATSLTVVTPPAKGTAVVSGTTITYQPNAGFAGPDSFTYTATNSGGTSAPATVTITVQDPVITITPSGGLTATVASPYTQTFAFDGGAPPWSEYQVTNLPAGLGITGTTANTVTISGTPTQAGSFTLNVGASDSSTGNGPFTVGQAFGLTVDAVVPGAPSIGAATAGDGEASVSFGEPAFTGGAPITAYTVTSNPGGLTGTGVGSPITVTGLSNGVAYTFTVSATNSAGTGAASEASNAVTPRGAQAALTAIATPSTVAFGSTSTLSTTGGSGGGEVSYAITEGAAFCSLSGSTLTATAIGTCTVTATKAAGGAFNAATATVEVTVVRAEQAPLTATASPSSIAFGGTSTLDTTGGSGTGAVSYAISAGSEFCSISSTTLTGIGVGICTVTATKAADANFNAATATVSVTVARANQAPLSVTATPSAIPLTRTTLLAATGGSGSGEVSFAVTAGASNCTISGSTLTGTGVGACTVLATKAGDAQFNPATAQATVVVQAATDLEVSKDDGTQYALPEGTVLYEILVANAGPLDVEGARLRDLLPAGLADALWTCTPLQLATCPQAAGEGGIDQTLTLPVNGVLRYRLSARVTAPLGSTLTNTATIDAPTGVIELQPSDNSASDSNLVVPEGLFGNGFEAAPNRISVPVRAW